MKDKLISSFPVFLFIFSFYNTNIKILSTLAIVSMYLYLLLIVIDKKFLVNIRRNDYLLFLIFIFGSFLVFTIKNQEPNFRFLVQTITLFIIYYLFSQRKTYLINNRIFHFSLLITTTLLYAPIIFKFGEFNRGHKSYYTTTTFLGYFSFLLIILNFVMTERSPNRFLLNVLLTGLVFLSQTRTVMFSIILFLLFLTFPFKKMKRFNLLSTAMMISVGIITYIFINIESYSWVTYVSDFTFKFTGKIFLTGRQEIWKKALEILNNNLMLGVPKHSYNLSLHNTYLLIFLDYGLLNFIVISLLLFIIIKNSFKTNENIKKVFSVFLVVLIISSFEVMLIQGQLILNIIIWSIFGFLNSEKGGNSYVTSTC